MGFGSCRLRICVEKDRIMKKIKNIISYLTTSVLFIIFISCEDDPLLAPQTDSSDDGGSYGLLILNEGEELDIIEDNPEIF